MAALPSFCLHNALRTWHQTVIDLKGGFPYGIGRFFFHRVHKNHAASLGHAVSGIIFHRHRPHPIHSAVKSPLLKVHTAFSPNVGSSSWIPLLPFFAAARRSLSGNTPNSLSGNKNSSACVTFPYLTFFFSSSFFPFPFCPAVPPFANRRRRPPIRCRAACLRLFVQF